MTGAELGFAPAAERDTAGVRIVAGMFEQTPGFKPSHEASIRAMAPRTPRRAFGLRAPLAREDAPQDPDALL